MITPTSITDFDRTERQLQVFWLFAICVAGKNADQTADKIGNMIRRNVPEKELPFRWLGENEHAIHNVLVANRIGQYTRIERAIRESLHLNLRTATLQELEAVHGVGPKTARFFLLHTRKDVKCAVLDTHILNWLREKCTGCSGGIPKATPSGARYLELERTFLTLARSYFPGATIAEIDLLIWSTQSGRLNQDNA